MAVVPAAPREATNPGFYPPLQSVRHFDGQNNVRSDHEYTFYPPHGTSRVYVDGKVTYFDSIHKASAQSTKEITVQMRLGQRGAVYDPRNEIGVAALGDKPYQAPEYSIDFHKVGSTRPVVNFG